MCIRDSYHRGPDVDNVQLSITTLGITTSCQQLGTCTSAGTDLNEALDLKDDTTGIDLFEQIDQNVEEAIQDFQETEFSNEVNLPTNMDFALVDIEELEVIVPNDVGGFDENIFLYGEDLDLCRRMTDTGYTIIFCSKARGDHLVSQATAPSRQIRWRKEWNIAWSHLYLSKKYNGSASAEAWGLLRKHGPKTLFYALVIQPRRFMRDLAVSHAALSFLMGGKPKRGP